MHAWSSATSVGVLIPRPSLVVMMCSTLQAVRRVPVGLQELLHVQCASNTAHPGGNWGPCSLLFDHHDILCSAPVLHLLSPTSSEACTAAAFVLGICRGYALATALKGVGPDLCWMCAVQQMSLSRRLAAPAVAHVLVGPGDVGLRHSTVVQPDPQCSVCWAERLPR